MTPFIVSKFFAVCFLEHGRSNAIEFSSLVVSRHLFALNFPKTFLPLLQYSWYNYYISDYVIFVLLKIYFVFWHII